MTLIFQADPYEFEELIAELLEEWGWDSVVTPGSNDRGIDILVNKTTPFPQKYAIQVKQYSEENKIGSPRIQQYSSITNRNEDIDGVIVATTSTFTQDARETGSDLGVKLLDGSDLVNLFTKPNGENVLKSHFDMSSESSTESISSETLAERDPHRITTESTRSPEPERRNETPERAQSQNQTPPEKRVFDAVCERYGRGLNGPTELSTQSCPECSGSLFGGKIMYMRESRDVKFCIDCETVFIKKNSGWKSKTIPL